MTFFFTHCLNQGDNSLIIKRVVIPSESSCKRAYNIFQKRLFYKAKEAILQGKRGYITR